MTDSPIDSAIGRDNIGRSGEYDTQDNPPWDVWGVMYFTNDEGYRLIKSVIAWSRAIFNPHTRRMYLYHVQNFLKWSDRPIRKLRREDVERYLSHLVGFDSRRVARHAIDGYQRHIGLGLDLTRIHIGKRTRVVPSMPTDEELARFWTAVDELDLAERTAIHLLADTGHRRHSVMVLPRDAIEINSDGVPVVTFEADSDKCGTKSEMPVSLETYKLCKELAEKQPGPTLIPTNWEHRDGWIWYQVAKAARHAGVRGMHPHTFRHLAAYKLKQAKVEADVAARCLGWKDGQMYSRYGQRNVRQCVAEVARALYPSAVPVVEIGPTEDDLCLSKGRYE